MVFATFIKCRLREAIRPSKNPFSAGVNRCATFSKSAVVALPMRVASAVEGRPSGSTKGVFVTTLGVVATGFALFFTGETGGTARNRYERRIACCCSSTCSINVTDSLIGVACFARSLRTANNSCMGAVARRGETGRSVALDSFGFYSFFSFSHLFLPFLSACLLRFAFLPLASFNSLAFLFFFFLLFLFFTFSLVLFFLRSLLLRFFTFLYSQQYGGFIQIRRRLSLSAVQHHLHLLSRIGRCWFLGVFLLRMLGSSGL